MKKSIYFLTMLMGVIFTGCEPMEDIHQDLDAQLENTPIEGVADYVLTDEDYETLELPFGNFSSLDDAKALIPTILEANYPVWGKGSLANVSFKLYSPLVMEDYALSTADYSAIGLSENYFTGMGDVEDFLAYQFPQASEGTYAELTYRTLAEEISYSFDNDDFDLIGEELGTAYPAAAASAAQYNNFDRREERSAYWNEDMILEAVNAVLSDNFAGVEGQTYEVSYAIYNGSAGTESMNVKFDGNSYIVVGGTTYEFNNDDYDLVGTELGTAYPGPAGNAAQYNSFDVRESSNNYWSEDMILEAINVVLMERYPSAVDGDQFAATYKVYNGSGTPMITKSVVLNSGSYVIDETSSISTISVTEVFAKAEGDWQVPFTLPANSYQDEFGQRFGNFGDEDEALYKIAIYLESVYPYAEEGFFVPVAYRFYNGSSTVTEYANFVFDGAEFNHIPSVINQSLQFGHNGEGWEPDNTIVYTLAPADYQFIGQQFAEQYVDPAWSVGNYNNFDRRPGNRNEWTNAMLLEAMDVLLDEKLAPNAEEGQKYVLTFSIYNGSNTTESISVIKANGEWVLN